MAPLDPAALRARFSSVGVTGTNGKTSTTSWVARAIAAALGPCLRVTTLGAAIVDEVGAQELEVPRTIGGFFEALERAAARGSAHAAIECTSESLAAGFARGWPVDVAAFTNLTHDHLDAHGSPEHYLASKAQLFLHLPEGGVAVLDGCDPAGALLAEVVPRHARIVRYGSSTRGAAVGALELEAGDVRVGREGTRCSLLGRGPFAEVPSSLAIRAHGAIFVENALAALAAAVSVGVPVRRAIEAIEGAPPPRGRFEIVNDRPCVVVDYAHTPDALERTLATARALAGERVLVVFGAGGARDRHKRPALGRAASVADLVVVTSDNPRDEEPAAIAAEVRAGLSERVRAVTELDRAAAIALALSEARPADVVVIAGKGHERTQIAAGVERPFDDVEVVRRFYGTSSRSAVPSPCLSRTS